MKGTGLIWNCLKEMAGSTFSTVCYISTLLSHADSRITKITKNASFSKKGKSLKVIYFERTLSHLNT